MTDSARFLGVDYGTKRIGLALSDPLMIFAYTFKTILNDPQLWTNLDAIVKEKQVSKIILGIPYQENGQLSSNAPGILKFKGELLLRYKLEIIELSCTSGEGMQQWYNWLKAKIKAPKTV